MLYNTTQKCIVDKDFIDNIIGYVCNLEWL